jgi:hypothetical protein
MFKQHPLRHWLVVGFLAYLRAVRVQGSHKGHWSSAKKWVFMHLYLAKRGIKAWEPRISPMHGAYLFLSTNFGITIVSLKMAIGSGVGVAYFWTSPARVKPYFWPPAMAAWEVDMGWWFPPASIFSWGSNIDHTIFWVPFLPRPRWNWSLAPTLKWS